MPKRSPAQHLHCLTALISRLVGASARCPLALSLGIVRLFTVTRFISISLYSVSCATPHNMYLFMSFAFRCRPERVFVARV